MSLALCRQVVSQASQRFWSSENQATCEGCFTSQSICSVISFHSGMSRAEHPLDFSKVDIDHFSLCSKLTESVRRMTIQRRAWVTASAFTVKLEVETKQAALPVFTDGSRTLLDSEASPWLVFADWAINVHYEVLRFAVFLNEKLDLWLCFACWLFSTVLSQVVWQKCFVETLESVWVPFPLVGLLELCQLPYLQYWVLCLTPSRLDPSQSASLCVFYGFLGVGCGEFRRHWSMIWPAPISVWLVMSQWVCLW